MSFLKWLQRDIPVLQPTLEVGTLVELNLKEGDTIVLEEEHCGDSFLFDFYSRTVEADPLDSELLVFGISEWSWSKITHKFRVIQRA